MFLQPQQAQQIVNLISNPSNTKEVEDILSVLAHNSDADTENGFRQAIQEEPYNGAHRLIYGDWLEERGRPHEAHLQRLIGSDPKMMNQLHIGLSRQHDPSIVYDNGWRAATPFERAALAQDRTLEVPGLHLNELNHAGDARRLLRLGRSKEAGEHHIQAAIGHLQKANSEDNPAIGEALRHRIAAHAHIIASNLLV